MPNVLILICFNSHDSKPSICFAGLSILFVEENVKYPGPWMNSRKESFTEYHRIIKIIN